MFKYMFRVEETKEVEEEGVDGGAIQPLDVIISIRVEQF